MATKREKKEEAKRLIDDSIPDFPIPRFAPAPIRVPNLIIRGAKELGKGLVEIDPLNIITDDTTSSPATAGEQIMMAMVNDPEFVLDAAAVDLINNPERMLVSNGQRMMEINGRDVIRRSGQFRRDMLLPRTNQKRTRRKTKTDKSMSKALAQANKELRKKNGQLRRGVTQADIMRRAHRIRRKMS